MGAEGYLGVFFGDLVLSVAASYFGQDQVFDHRTGERSSWMLALLCHDPQPLLDGQVILLNNKSG